MSDLRETGCAASTVQTRCTPTGQGTALVSRTKLRRLRRRLEARGMGPKDSTMADTPDTKIRKRRRGGASNAKTPANAKYRGDPPAPPAELDDPSSPPAELDDPSSPPAELDDPSSPPAEFNDHRRRPRPTGATGGHRCWPPLSVPARDHKGPDSIVERIAFARIGR